MKVLITGGAGFIGSHIVEHFQEEASEIRVLDNLRTGNLDNLIGLDHTFIKGSINDRDLVQKSVQDIDYIFHLAALVSVPESMTKISECIEINVNGTLNLLEAASEAGVKKIVFASSAAVYGDNPTSPKLETMCPAPKSPYAITKLDGEYYMEMFHNENKIQTTSLRFFNVFGPRQDPQGAYAAAVPIFMENTLHSRNITIFGDGQQTRDFIYVKDIVEALVYAVTNKQMKGVYNAGYGQPTSINHLAETIIGMDDTECAIEHKPSRIGDIEHSLASAHELKAAGWKPKHTLEQGLRETFASYKKSQRV